MYFINKEKSTNPKFIEENLNDLCASIQHTINNVLLKKMSHAVESTGIKTISIAGGVSANSNLRSVFEQAAKHNNWGLYIPSFKYCTDNAAMIAMSGSFAAKYGMEGSLSDQPSAKMDFIVA
jgi:N6-L-threonylcarbamoyladenine synthase